MLTEERKIRLRTVFNFTREDGRKEHLQRFSWQTAVELNDTTLVRCAFGEWHTIRKDWYDEDDLKEILEKNGHLCRSDFE